MSKGTLPEKGKACGAACQASEGRLGSHHKSQPHSLQSLGCLVTEMHYRFCSSPGASSTLQARSTHVQGPEPSLCPS